MPGYAGLPAAARYRTLFLSDLHLGAQGCHVEKILHFLQTHEAENIYLVGDIFDLGRRRPQFWSPRHDEILSLLKARQAAGMTLIRLPGNHDPCLAPQDTHPHSSLIPAHHDYVIHQAADKRRYLITHGHCCDFWLGRSHLMSRVGSYLEGRMRRCAAKHHQPRQSGFVSGFVDAFNSLLTWGGLIEKRLVALARQHGVDGVVCGHLHRAALNHYQGTLYANCGDWISSMSALVEDHHGTLSLIDWCGAPLLQAAEAPLSVLAELEQPEEGMA
ncbi:UDP-2,3-diacylglucosamine diphosphatase [Candidatus Pantoea multigeneris]|nr:UDP-2,3-diacylglucosamine diphosphatase [Pantoea multigeneris]